MRQRLNVTNDALSRLRVILAGELDSGSWSEIFSHLSLETGGTLEVKEYLISSLAQRERYEDLAQLALILGKDWHGLGRRSRVVGGLALSYGGAELYKLLALAGHLGHSQCTGRFLVPALKLLARLPPGRNTEIALALMGTENFELAMAVVTLSDPARNGYAATSGVPRIIFSVGGFSYAPDRVRDIPWDEILPPGETVSTSMFGYSYGGDSERVHDHLDRLHVLTGIPLCGTDRHGVLRSLSPLP